MNYMKEMAPQQKPSHSIGGNDIMSFLWPRALQHISSLCKSNNKQIIEGFTFSAILNMRMYNIPLQSVYIDETKYCVKNQNVRPVICCNLL